MFSDINTKNQGDLGISIVSAYTREFEPDKGETIGKMESFWESDFDRLWPLFQKADRIIGFNTLHFDIPALQPYAFFPLEKLAHFDILEKVKESCGHRISLSVLARDNLKQGKIDSGSNAVLYWNQHDKISLEKLQKYCEQDVLVTRDLYDLGLKRGILNYTDKWNEHRTCKVDFAYQENKKEEIQTGLF